MTFTRDFHPGLVRLAYVTTILLCSVATTRAFTFPTSSSSIAHLSGIAASHTCSASSTGFTCADTCPTRTDYPNKQALLQSVNVVNVACDVTLPTSPSLPTQADENEGTLTFSGDVTACPSHEMTNAHSSFSLSVWLHTNCDDCAVLSLGGGADVRVSAGKLQLGGKEFAIGNTNWFHLVITLPAGGPLIWFVNGGVGATTSLSAVGNKITFGPTTNLTSTTEVMSFADAQLYDSPLTLREIIYLFTGTLTTLPRDSDCRCPDDAPRLVEDTTGENYLKCTDIARSMNVSRLNPDAHPDVFMIDTDPSSFWNSGTTREATVTLALSKVFQLSTLTVKGIQIIPDEMEVQLKVGTSVTSTLTFKNDCTSQTNCHEYETDISTSGTLMYDFQSDDITTRDDVISVTADSVEITFKSGANTFYTVSELELEARCHCFGNDNNCAITGTDYTCSCFPGSHTSGPYCDTCEDEFYRQAHEELTCPSACGCDDTGSEDNICAEVAGQCTCKANVDPDGGRICDTCKHNVNLGSDAANGCTACDCVPEYKHSSLHQHQNYAIIQHFSTCIHKVAGQCPCKANVDPDVGRICDTCKHNTVNHGSDVVKGCTACDCVPEGIVRCEESDQSCTCKTNVESSSGRCEECVADHYDIKNAAGCLPCECDSRGTQQGDHCNKTTGQCPCRTNVEGRKCDVCKDGYFELKNSWVTGCIDCKCNFVGSLTLTCNKTSGQCPCTDGSSKDMHCKPAILSVEPQFGPIAGGTKVSIVGYLLGPETATGVTVSIDDTHQTVTERNEALIVIETAVSSTEKTVEVALAWTKTGVTDPYQIPLTQTFTFMPDPVINVPTTSFKTYASGGCSVDITGQYLTSVYKPMLMVHNDPKTDTRKTVCSQSSKTQMTCKTPNVTSYTTAGELAYGFWLDNVAEFRDLSSNSTRFEIVPDPEIDMEKMIDFRNTFDKDIKITGQGLSLACDDRDVRVIIGEKDCQVTARTNNSITCDPGEDFPGSNREEEIMVHIGNIVVRHGIVNFKSFWTHPAFIGAVAGLGAVIILIIVVCVICRLRRRTNSFKRSNGGGGQLNGGVELDEGGKARARPNDYNKWPKPGEKPLPTEPEARKRDSREDFLSRLEPSVSSLVTSSMVDRTQIEPGQVCTHKGKKIRVILGQFGSGTSSSYAGNPIFIKTLVSAYPETDNLPSWLGDGLKECTRLQNSVHENVLRLLGIAVDGKQVYILYPEMTNRTLKDHLTSAKKAFTNEEKLDLCVQVVEGMQFLSSDNVVHRDLAARNCWVSADRTVKIADASFSYDLYPDEYLFQNGRHQPVRWMAPESLRQSGFYTTKADVWSFGVLMWEVFTNGYLPYAEVKSNSEISDYVCTKHFRLGKPAGCPDNVWSVIEQCQADYGDARPIFAALLDLITDIISPSDGGGENMYQNQEALVNEQEEAGMELYENTQIGPGGLPPRPPKRY